MLYFIWKILNQGSREIDDSFGGFGIIFVVDFHILPPIGDTPIYYEDASDSYLLCSSIQYLVIIQNIQRQQGDDSIQGAFKQILSCCTETDTRGGLLQEDWDVLKTRFIQNATDARNERWNYAPYMINENKSCFE